MKRLILLNILVSAITIIDCSSISRKDDSFFSKVFNYHGSMPIKDDRTGEIIKADGNDTDLLPQPARNQTASEAACWNLINEQSEITFALQNRVLNELQKELNILEFIGSVREQIDSTSNKMKTNMNDALEALKSGSAEEYFDSLFDSSENIVQMSALLRDPKLDEKVFLALVKAVSRLGRNNSMLIQEFTDRCSFVQRSPRPRDMTSA